MKNNFRILSILLVIVIILSFLIIPSSALTAPILYGDLNSDDIIDVLDATALQRHLAKIDQYLRIYSESADVDDDAKLTVMDATLIQQYVARNISEFPAGEHYFLSDDYIGEIVADYDRDKAIAVYPVTFSLDGNISLGPVTARLYVNEQLVAETQAYNKETGKYDLTYTFETAGAYRVKATLSGKWGGEESATALYIVKDAPTDTTTPIITSITRDSEYSHKPTITANAKFGTEPYQYKYTLTCDTYNDELVYYTDFIDSNTLNLYEEFPDGTYLESYNCYTVAVEVKDANGKIAKDSYSFRIEVPVPSSPSPF